MWRLTLAVRATLHYNFIALLLYYSEKLGLIFSCKIIFRIFPIQATTPSTNYSVPFHCFTETWCDMNNYKVPNVVISELCCWCQKGRHEQMCRLQSIYLPINLSIPSFKFWVRLVTNWNRQLLFLYPIADISTTHHRVGKLRNSCNSLTWYENGMYLVLRSLCWLDLLFSSAKKKKET